MDYQILKHLKEEDFRRRAGVKHATFRKMVELLKQAEREKNHKGGSQITWI